MSLKKFNIEHTPTCAQITVEIDFNFKNEFNGQFISMEDYIKEMVEFWSGWKQRFEENENSYVNTFLKFLCQQCMSIASQRNWSLPHIIAEFNELEGWCSLTGSNGIKLLNISRMEISEQEEYEITELMYNSITNN